MAVMTACHSIDLLVERLRSHPYFLAVDSPRLVTLAEHAVCHTFAPGEIIFMEEAASAGLWIINEGHVKIYKLSADGNEHIMHLLGPGDSFNDIAALDGGPNPANAAAMSAVACCNISYDTLVMAIESDPVLAMTLIRFLTSRTRELVQQVEDLALYSVTTRLARFLLKQAGTPSLNGAAITRVAIAAHLATKPETISRALSTLEKSGVVAADRSAITILREDMLRMVAML